MNTFEQDASNQLDRAARQIMESEGIKYDQALKLAMARDPETAHRYNFGAPGAGVKTYQLSSIAKRMLELQSDPDLTRRLAGEVLTHHAQELAVKLDSTHQLRPETLSQAMKQIANDYPSLFAASENGFISSTDYFLLGLLIPSVAGAVEKEKGIKPVMSYRDERTEVRRYEALKRYTLDVR